MPNKSYLRNIIGEYMSVLGQMDERVVVVNADLSGTCRNTGFVDKYPNRAFNVGIAEQNMISFAAGLAHEGYIPYTFSMVPFISMRACEQVRTDVAYGRKKVRMIGVYAGVSGGISGATHWGIEDCGIMTSMPGINVIEVSDAVMAKKILNLSLENDEPMYIRCTVETTEDIYDDIDVRIGGSQVVVEGDDGAILCSGVLVQYAIEASKKIKEETGKRIRVVDMYSIKPLDEEAVLSAIKTGNVIVAQDHNIIGGLGSMVATVIASSGKATNYRILGIDDRYVAMAHPKYLYHEFGIDADGLEKAMIEMLEGKR